MPAFVLPLQDLDESERLWRFAVSSAWLANALADTDLKPGAQNGRLEVHGQRSGQDILIRGEVHTLLLAQCARCLGDVPLTIDAPVTALMSPEHMRPAVQEEVELEADDLDQEYFGGTEIVLDGLVREQLILAVPMKPLCADNCTGIEIPDHVRPPADVFEQRTGPFAALSQLKDKLRKSEE